MNLQLPLLADINLHIGVAEEAVAEGSWSTARINLEKAEASLQELRDQWPDLDSSEKGLLSALVKPLKGKYEACAAKVPKLEVISQGEVVKDDDEDLPPEE